MIPSSNTTFLTRAEVVLGFWLGLTHGAFERLAFLTAAGLSSPDSRPASWSAAI